VLSCNAYGDDHLDGGLTCCREEQQGSIIGELTRCTTSLRCKCKQATVSAVRRCAAVILCC
jgi:hypothetical protein